MTKTNTPVTEITADSVTAGKQAIRRELEAAQLELEASSFQAAVSNGDKTARDALERARNHVLTLRDELAALEMVEREIARRQRIQGRQVEIDAMRALEVQANTAVDLVHKAFDRVRKAIIELAAANNELKQLAETARTATVRLNSEAISGSQLQSVGHVARELLYHHAGNDFDSAGVLQRPADYFGPAIDGIVSQAKALIEAGVAAKLDADQERLEPEIVEVVALRDGLDHLLAYRNAGTRFMIPRSRLDGPGSDWFCLPEDAPPPKPKGARPPGAGPKPGSGIRDDYAEPAATGDSTTFVAEAG